MARLLTLDSVTISLRNALLSSLRPEDEGLLLPQASQSLETGVFKNCVFRVAGDSTGVNTAIFSHDLFSGVSIVQLCEADAQRIGTLLESADASGRMLAQLAEAIPSEVADPSLQVGPALDGDDLERDVESSEWHAGFDSSSACVGIFTAQNSKAPDTGQRGCNRVFNQYFLVCKAGGGIAAATFHTRLLAALSKPGATLDSALGEGGTVGAAALRRLASAGTRNRHRILFQAAQVLGLKGVQDVGDQVCRCSRTNTLCLCLCHIPTTHTLVVQASRNKHRGAVVDVDIVVNSLRRLDDAARSTWQVTNAVDCNVSKGLASMSNLTDGILLFLDANGDKKVHLKSNEAWGTVPFSTPRLVDERAMVAKLMACNFTSGDAAWIKRRFAWRNRTFDAGQPNVMPFCFFGSHDTESFAKSFGRELGLASLNAVRLRPELVATAGVASGKLRALVSRK